ncbi:hypothetical protein J8J14_22935 [Roseomonas sp. SSH11]|uniref:Lipoprotein n=1 Tax=Pararoseomonas baculiformis TaxID=2820812 RepID=A0ABS4AKR8_9PROT|nr:hypothetical protein [Pararoseomonas baculiformis]MBP0447618.1 hypothetical protein [Pararoseomonas baculiformis]
MTQPRGLLLLAALAALSGLLPACTQGYSPGATVPGVTPLNPVTGPISRGNPGTGRGQEIMPDDNRGASF